MIIFSRLDIKAEHIFKVLYMCSLKLRRCADLIFLCVPKDCKSHIVKDFSLKDKAFMSGTMDLNVISLGLETRAKPLRVVEAGKQYEVPWV